MITSKKLVEYLTIKTISTKNSHTHDELTKLIEFDSLMYYVTLSFERARV